MAIRASYHCVPDSIPIFLYLDNAGGHGTREIVDAYIRMLKDEYNVICIHQRPCSPEMNMLDLGVWMAIQSVVEKMHFCQRTEVEALFRTVTQSWKDFESIKLENVYHRIIMVLDLIIDDGGGNRLVESKRGKLFRAPRTVIETESSDNEFSSEVENDENADDSDDELN